MAPKFLVIRDLLSNFGRLQVRQGLVFDRRAKKSYDLLMSMTLSNKLVNTNKGKPNRYLAGGAVLIIIIIYVVMALGQSFPVLSAETENIPTKIPNIPAISWPAGEQAAVGAQGYGVLAKNGQQASHPIASIAKTILALAVLQQKPLAAGQTGPTLTMTDQDVTFYKDNLAQNGSIVPVNVGEKLTEYQMLQALLLPSGDNIADTLAVWGFGSIDNYLAFGNKMVAKWGLKQTHVADASGLSPQTVSSAEDLVTIASKVMDEPSLAEIVGQAKATLPVAGVVNNYDTILGQDGVVGIKTGNTEEAGGCFMFAAKVPQNGKAMILTGAILGASTRGQALNDTKKLLETNSTSWQEVELAKAGQAVGHYKTPGGDVKVISKKELSVAAVHGSQATVKIDLQKINKPQTKGAEVGTITIKSGANTITGPAILDKAIPAPTIWWKLTHP